MKFNIFELSPRPSATLIILFGSSTFLDEPLQFDRIAIRLLMGPQALALSVDRRRQTSLGVGR